MAAFVPSGKRQLGRIVGWLGLFALAPCVVVGQPAERGFPLLQTYSFAVEPSAPESFDVAQDSRGLLYVGNLSGILIYDGHWWHRLSNRNGSAAFALASDGGGRVAVGGVDELGYVSVGAGGALGYHSLTARLPESERELGEVRAVQPTAEGFVFVAERRVLTWDGSALTPVAELAAGSAPAAAHRVGDEVYVWVPDGLKRLAGRSLEPVAGGEQFRGRRVALMLPAEGGALLGVEGEGLYLFSGGRAVPFAPEASRWAVAKRLTRGRRLPDGRYAFASVHGGLLLLHADGTVDQVIDTAVGLADDFVTGLTVDREGSLWLSLHNGLARLEVSSPLSVIDGRAGLKGSPMHVTRHQGHLWIATSAGVFTTQGVRADPAGPLHVRPVRGLPAAPAWSLLSLGHVLAVGTSAGVYLVGESGVRPVPGTEATKAYLLAFSQGESHRVWVGMREGLGVLLHEQGEWRWGGQVAGVPRYVRSLVEREKGVLWCGTTFDGLARVEVASDDLPARRARVTVKPGRGDGGVETGIFQVGDHILGIWGDRVLLLDETTGALAENPSLVALNDRGQVFNGAQDAAGNVWLNTKPPTVAVDRGAGRGIEARSLVSVVARDIQQIIAEPDGVVWLATERGLFRHAGTFHGEPAVPPAPRVRRVTLAGGALPVTSSGPVLPPDSRRLRIELGPVSYRPGLAYQTRLDPLDGDWGEATAEPFVEIGRLPAGAYTLRARTRGPNGELGPETEWPFRVQPPWYGTPWAIALWAALGLVVVGGYTRLRSHTLRQRAGELESRVAEQTLELRRAVDELSRAQGEVVEKNRLLEVANERLEELSLHDDLTAIFNRRRLQQALDEEWNRARRQRSPLAFVLLDLDHFKRLNDSRGHREGDQALRAVAHHLAEHARRTGDLAARFGGEEFALLLPGSDIQGALRVAEELRAGIEALGLPHPEAPGGRLTASLGVAALTPGPEDRPETLIEAADAALYRAKTEGRNRVRAAGWRRRAAAARRCRPWSPSGARAWRAGPGGRAGARARPRDPPRRALPPRRPPPRALGPPGRRWHRSRSRRARSRSR